MVIQRQPKRKHVCHLGGNEAYVTTKPVRDVLVLGGSALGLEYSVERFQPGLQVSCLFPPPPLCCCVKELIMYSCIENHKGARERLCGKKRTIVAVNAMTEHLMSLYLTLGYL